MHLAAATADLGTESAFEVLARATALAARGKDFAHFYRHITKIDVDRAGVEAFVADRAMVGHIVHLLEVAQAQAPPGLFLIQKGLDDQPAGEDLVAG